MRSFSARAGLIFLLATAGARASDLGGGTLSVVRRDAAGDCPDDVELRSSTLALGTLPPAAPAEPLNVEVTFAREEGAYVARILTSGSTEGVREIRKEDPNCASLAEAVSLVLAVVFDLSPPEPAPIAPVPVPPPPPPAETTPSPAPPAPKAPAQPFSLGVVVQGAASFGLLGDALVGALSVAVRPRWGHWEIAPGVLWAPGRTVEYLEGSVDVSLLSARLEACGWLSASRRRPDVALCLGFFAGALRGAGEDYQDAHPATDAWFAFEAGAAGRWPISAKWALRLGISALIPTRDQAFAVNGAGNAFESSPAAFLGELGPELSFP